MVKPDSGNGVGLFYGKTPDFRNLYNDLLWEQPFTFRENYVKM